MTFMNFTEDTVEQKAESVGRVMPHTEVGPRQPPSHHSPGCGPWDIYCFQIRDPNSSLQTLRAPSHEVFLGLAWGFLCGLRPELGRAGTVASCQLNFSAASLPV